MSTFRRTVVTTGTVGYGGGQAQRMPTDVASSPGQGPSVQDVLAHPLIDLSQVSGWRTVLVLGAAAYVFGFHLTLGRVRVNVGRR